MDTTSDCAVLTAAAPPVSPVAGGGAATAKPYSTASLLQRTTAANDVAPWPHPIDHAALERQAHELRGAYIASVAQRWMNAIRRSLRQSDRQTRFIWP